MTRKLKCTITGNWSYCSEDRFQKLVAQFGSEEALINGYVSREGKKLLAANEEDVSKAQAAAQAVVHKNKIACTVTGELMFISDERMKHLCETGNTDEEGVRAGYVNRVAKRLRKEEANKVEAGKSFADLTQDQQLTIDEGLKARFDAGDWPATAAPKGSKQEKAEKAPKAAKAEKAEKPETEVRDTVPAATEALDPLRHIENESSKERKNRIRRERAALNRV